MNGNYGKRILLALRMGRMTAYRLSKEISRGDARVSSGTIYPALQRLTEEGLISTVKHGKRTLFTLTESGTEYVNELVLMRKSIASRFFSNSVNEAMLGADFIANLEELRIMRSVVEDLSGSLIGIIRSAFCLKRKKMLEEYSDLIESVREVSESDRAR